MDEILDIFNIDMLNNYDLSLGNYNSVSQNISNCSLYSMQYVWSVTTGTITVTISASNNDKDFVAFDTFIPSALAGNRMVNIEKAGYKFFRVEVTASGATGLIMAIANGKNN